MALRVALYHRTRYEYDRAVWLGPHGIRLRPAAHTRTPIQAYALRITPPRHTLAWQQDAYGNWIGRVVFEEITSELDIDVELIAEMRALNPFNFLIADRAEQFPLTYADDERRALDPYLETEPPGPRLDAWLTRMRAELCSAPIRTIDFLVAVNRALAGDIRYLVRMEPGVRSGEETLEQGCGSCRDSAWLLAQILRHSGVAARFVSGYLIQLGAEPPEGPGAEGDNVDLHAWCEAYVPGAGWIGLDATSGLLVAEGHIPLACAAVPAAAAPVHGYTGEAQSTLSYEMQVTRVEEHEFTISAVPVRLYPFRYRDPDSGQWRTATHPAELREIRLRYGEFEITGEPVSLDPASDARVDPRHSQ